MRWSGMRRMRSGDGGGGGGGVSRLLERTRWMGSVVGFVGRVVVVARMRLVMSSTLVVVVVAEWLENRLVVATLAERGLSGMVVAVLVVGGVGCEVSLARIAMGGCSPSGLSRRKTSCCWCAQSFLVVRTLLAFLMGWRLDPGFAGIALFLLIGEPFVVCGWWLCRFLQKAW
jgi:hypothetical protein